MTDKTELLPCPFCGTMPQVVDGINPGTQKSDPGWGTIFCENDTCGVNPSVDYYNGLEQGKYAWNTRAPRTHSGHKEVEDLIKVGEQLIKSAASIKSIEEKVKLRDFVNLEQQSALVLALATPTLAALLEENAQIKNTLTLIREECQGVYECCGKYQDAYKKLKHELDRLKTPASGEAVEAEQIRDARETVDALLDDIVNHGWPDEDTIKGLVENRFILHAALTRQSVPNIGGIIHKLENISNCLWKHKTDKNILLSDIPSGQVLTDISDACSKLRAAQQGWLVTKDGGGDA